MLELFTKVADISNSSHEVKNLGILGSKLSTFLTLKLVSKFHTFVSLKLFPFQIEILLFVIIYHFTTQVVKLSGSFGIIISAFQSITLIFQL